MHLAPFLTLTFLLLIALGPTPGLTKWKEKKQRKKDMNRNVAHHMRIHMSIVPKRAKLIFLVGKKKKYHCRPWATKNLTPCGIACVEAYYTEQLGCPLNDRVCICNSNHFEFFKHSRCLMEQCEASEVHFTLNELSHRCDVWRELPDEDKEEKHDKVSQYQGACEINKLSEEASMYEKWDVNGRFA